MFSALFISIGVFLISGVNGRSSGAPNEACVNSNMVPQHGRFSSQKGPSPFGIEVSSSTYQAGGTLTVTLLGSESFKGFLVMALPANLINGAPFGSFNVVEDAGNALSQSLCEGGATHTYYVRNNPQSRITLTWNAPSTATGNVIFYATFVQRFNTFWVKVSSPIVTLQAATRPTTTTQAATQPTTTTQAATRPTTTTQAATQPTTTTQAARRPTTTTKAVTQPTTTTQTATQPTTTTQAATRPTDTTKAATQSTTTTRTATQPTTTTRTATRPTTTTQINKFFDTQKSSTEKSFMATQESKIRTSPRNAGNYNHMSTVISCGIMVLTVCLPLWL